MPIGACTQFTFCDSWQHPRVVIGGKSPKISLKKCRKQLKKKGPKRSLKQVKNDLMTKKTLKNKKSYKYWSLKMIFKVTQSSDTFLEKGKKCWLEVKKQGKIQCVLPWKMKQTNFVTFCFLGGHGGGGRKIFFSQVILQVLLHCFRCIKPHQSTQTRPRASFWRISIRGGGGVNHHLSLKN